MRSEMFGGKIMLALARRTVHDRDLILFCPSPQTTAEASCHSHQMIVVQVFVGTVQRAPPYADASAKLTPPEISVQNYAIHAIITAFEKIVVQRAQLVWHVSERNRSAPLPQLLTRSCPTGAIFSEHTLRKNVVSYSKRCEINCRYSSSSDTEFSEEKTHTRAKAFVVVIGWGWMGRLRWRLGAAAGGEQWPNNLLSQ